MKTGKASPRQRADEFPFSHHHQPRRLRESTGDNKEIDMSQPLTLTSIFEATKEELVSSLSGLVLPKDTGKVQQIIAEYLNSVCDENSDYRQNLTQSEDYILQAALSMLNAQRDLVAAFDCAPAVVTEVIDESEPSDKADISIKDDMMPQLAGLKMALNPKKNIDAKKAVIGAGGGALVGKIILGGWGAVFGAIAGTAVALYLSQQSQGPRSDKKQILATTTPAAKVTLCDTPVNVVLLINVIKQICESLDNLVATFRAQIQRVVNKYESQEKPTIERDFRVLLEGIQSLIGYKRGHNPEEEKYLTKLQTRVEDLAELLDNYDLEAVDYTSDHPDWFEAIESKNATDIRMVSPAIIKDGNLVLKGKIFIPKS